MKRWMDRLRCFFVGHRLGEVRASFREDELESVVLCYAVCRRCGRSVYVALKISPKQQREIRPRQMQSLAETWPSMAKEFLRIQEVI